MKRKFEYFHNHGDDEGNNSLTICFGDSDHETDHIIVGAEDTEEDAIEAVKRLNRILDQHAAQCVEEFKEKLKISIWNRYQRSDFQLTITGINKDIDSL